MITDTYEEFELNALEYAFLLADSSYTGKSFKMIIPKVMPLIPLNEPVVALTTYNSRIFVNSPDCIPDVVSTTKTQNFLTVPLFPNKDFKYKADENGNIKKGEKFIVAIMNKNIRDVHVTDNL